MNRDGPLTQAEELFATSQNATLLYKPQSLDRILEFLAVHLAPPGSTERARVV